MVKRRKMIHEKSSNDPAFTIKGSLIRPTMPEIKEFHFELKKSSARGGNCRDYAKVNSVFAMLYICGDKEDCKHEQRCANAHLCGNNSTGGF